MFKLFKKYELQFKVVAVFAWMLGATGRIFFESASSNRNFDLFIGTVMALLGVFYLFEVIDLIRRNRSNSEVKN